MYVNSHMSGAERQERQRANLEKLIEQRDEINNNVITVQNVIRIGMLAGADIDTDAAELIVAANLERSKNFIQEVLSICHSKRITQADVANVFFRHTQTQLVLDKASKVRTKEIEGVETE